MHLKHLEAFLIQMRKHNLTLMHLKHLEAFLIRMNPERIESLLNMKIPETKKQVNQT